MIGTSNFQILFVTAFITFLQAVRTRRRRGAVAAADPGRRGRRAVGVGFAERLKAEQLRAGLALLVLAVAVRMAMGLVVTPPICSASGRAATVWRIPKPA